MNFSYKILKSCFIYILTHIVVPLLVTYLTININLKQNQINNRKITYEKLLTKDF